MTTYDRIAHIAHQLLEEKNIVKSGQVHAEYFVGLEEMAQIGSAIMGTRFTSAIRFERLWIFGMGGVSEPQSSVAGKDGTIARVAGGHHAVEHVDTGPDRFN